MRRRRRAPSRSQPGSGGRAPLLAEVSKCRGLDLPNFQRLGVLGDEPEVPRLGRCKNRGQRRPRAAELRRVLGCELSAARCGSGGGAGGNGWRGAAVEKWLSCRAGDVP